MTTVIIKQEFHDKDLFSKVYAAGSVCEFDDGRASELVSKGLAGFVKCESTSIEAKPKRQRKGIDE